MSDLHQWPSATFSDAQTSKELLTGFVPNSQNRMAIKNDVEEYFGFLQQPTILFPSARSAISTLLRLKGLDRSNTVFITKFSSHCLFTSLGSFTNLSTDFVSPDAVLVNHKWGFANIETRIQSKKIYSIADSCDSIINDPAILFPNHENAAVISLPKVIGSISGAILVLNSSYPGAELDEEYLRQVTTEGATLGVWQADQKMKDIIGRSDDDFSTWMFYEDLNTYTTEVEILDILRKLPRWEENAKVIKERQLILSDFGSMMLTGNSRLGPVALLENQASFVFSNTDSENFLRRNFDIARTNDNPPTYTEVLAFPIHHGIQPQRFLKQYQLIERLMG